MSMMAWGFSTLSLRSHTYPIISQRLLPAFCNATAGYAKSAEEKLGLSKPKRPTPIFFKFVKQIKPALIEKNPDLNIISVIKLASKHWQQLDQKVKEKFSDEYEKEMAQYRKLKASFDASLSDDQKNKIRKMEYQMSLDREKKRVKAQIKELGKPKKPSNSYLLFCQDHKDLLKEVGLMEYQTIMKDKWYTLSAKEKEFWDNKAKVLKEAYRKELTEWEEKMIESGQEDFVRNIVLSEKMPSKSKKASGA